jgi:hypothetical protein
MNVNWIDDDEGPAWEGYLLKLRDGGFLGREEGVLRRGLASLNRGWLARGGLLRLHADALSFEPNPLERLLGARRSTFPLELILRAERRPDRPGEPSSLAQPARIRLHMADGARVDLIPAGGPDGWLEAIREAREVWERRQRFREGLPAAPPEPADGGREGAARRPSAVS